jgi:hypothetical protein
MASRLARMLPNPAARILAMKDTLALSDDQAARLTALRDTLDRQNGPLADSIRAAVQQAGANPDLARLFADVRPKLQAGRANVQRALEEAQRILTPAQWALVPAEVKSPGGGRRRFER